MEIGDKIKVKVVRLSKFGASTESEDGSPGIIHISQVSHDYVVNIQDYLRVGDELEVKIIGKKDDGKWDLSLKALEENNSSRVKVKRGQNPAFEKMMKEYLRSSEESHGTLKRRREGKR